ncbi:hypothetical protein V1512DRAFT_210338 [Lipomyces arxii]|uniref:uncharacterized protein n=1 Tax=Lipomyces arxii TaxID=56418 RepID=UPI0034CF3DD8
MTVPEIRATEQDIPILDSTAAEIEASKKKWKLGLLLIFVVVILWVLSSFMVNAIFESNVYRKPYLVTYLSTASFTLYLIKPLMDGKLSLNNNGFKQLDTYDDDAHESASISSAHAHSTENGPDSPELANNATDHSLPPLTVRETARLSLYFCVLWFLANWLQNASLSYTTVASGTILACTSSFFTLIIGSFLGVEKFTTRKLFAIAVSLGGIILISTQDDAEDNDDNDLTAGSIVFGDIISLMSAVIYGLYTSLLKVKIGDESRINMQIFFGFVGLWNVILLWPVLIFLHITGYETLQMPPSSFVWLIIIGNSLVTFFSDYLWIVTILITSPLVVTVGLSGTIPIAVVGDVVFNHIHVTIWYILGAVLIGCAFFIINREEEGDHLHEIEDNASMHVLDETSEPSEQ